MKPTWNMLKYGVTREESEVLDAHEDDLIGKVEAFATAHGLASNSPLVRGFAQRLVKEHRRKSKGSR